jgi:hypothetical protein
MPLFFAIAGIAAICLSLAILVGPILLIVGLVRAVRLSHNRSSAVHPAHVGGLSTSPVDTHLADAAFVDLISREWPADSPSLRPSPS